MTAFRLFFIFLVLSSTQGLGEESVKEIKCIAPPSNEQLGLDWNWMGSVKEFFIPIWSRLHSYRIASDQLGKEVDSITEAEVKPGTACLDFKQGHIVTGYGKTAKYDISVEGASLVFRAPWAGAKQGVFAFHLTDNKNFLLGVNCWEDNLASWSVMSPNKVLDEEITSKVLDYIASVGFNRSLALVENYEGC